MLKQKQGEGLVPKCTRCATGLHPGLGRTSPIWWFWGMSPRKNRWGF